MSITICTVISAFVLPADVLTSHTSNNYLDKFRKTVLKLSSKHMKTKFADFTTNAAI